MKGKPERDAPEPSDRALIQRVIAKDDHTAFEELVRRHQSPVRQFLRRLTSSDPERADDLAQDAFFKAYRHLASYRGDGSFRSWLFSVAYQLFASEERRQRLDFAPLEVEPAKERIEGEEVVSSQTVRTMLAALRDEERAAILLCYQHELTHEEAAAALDLPLGTLKSLVRRGRMKMQQMHTSRAKASTP